MSKKAVKMGNKNEYRSLTIDMIASILRFLMDG